MKKLLIGLSILASTSTLASVGNSDCGKVVRIRNSSRAQGFILVSIKSIKGIRSIKMPTNKNDLEAQQRYRELVQLAQAALLSKKATLCLSKSVDDSTGLPTGVELNTLGMRTHFSF